MPPKTNSKAAAGRARKEENANNKKAADAAKAEAAESAKWEQGGKGRSKADDKADKAAAAAAKKAELERLKKEDDDATPDKKPKPPSKAGKKAPPPSKPAAGPGLDDALSSFSASNIDDALDALTLANESNAKDKVGSKAGAIDAHPERRFKAAFEAYKEAEMPRIRQERPGLRKQQYENELFEEFKKSPANPFNQLNVAYNSTKEDRVEALNKNKDAIAKRLADRS
ncbi:unnamed protein product [Sympodiomycopsis kandeliae]